jgi:hypothetical protein
MSSPSDLERSDDKQRFTGSDPVASVLPEILHPAILNGWWSTAATRRNQRAAPGEKEKGRRMVHLEGEK